MTDPSEALKALDDAATRYEQTKDAHEAAKEDAIAAVIAALKADVPPTVVADRSPFTAAYVRKLARDANIPPAKPGIKPKARSLKAASKSTERTVAMRTRGK
ncbi:hypothetical protein JNW88_00180 [Micromonospora sp. ATA32]|nr:hypothetical protein [Micromonospora sp. ATA32]